jgi:hypothetical protein
MQLPCHSNITNKNKCIHVMTGAVNTLVRGCSQFAKQLPATAPVGPLQYAMKVGNGQ